MIYRYQEYLDGLHNFDDFHCFTLSFMLFLRAFVEVNLEHCTIVCNMWQASFICNLRVPYIGAYCLGTSCSSVYQSEWCED